MRKLVLGEFMSLDGVIQAPGAPDEDTEGGFKHGGWQMPFVGEEHFTYIREGLLAAGALLLGRKTYDIFAAYWPNVTDEGDDIARAINTLPKYVASRTLMDPSWRGTTVLRDVPREVAKLKEQPGEDIIVIGSSGLAQTLMQHDLVDEYQLWFHPIVLGSGKRLFRDGTGPNAVTLVDSKTISNGVVVLTYRPAERVQG